MLTPTSFLEQNHGWLLLRISNSEIFPLNYNTYVRILEHIKLYHIILYMYAVRLHAHARGARGQPEKLVASIIGGVAKEGTQTY